MYDRVYSTINEVLRYHKQRWAILHRLIPKYIARSYFMAIS